MTSLPILSLFGFGFEGTRLPDHVRRLLDDGLGGVILFARNLRSLEQICDLTSELHAAASAPLLVGVDQEGGRVTRLPAPFLPAPAAAALGTVDDPALTKALSRAVGRELLAAGFTWNLAPVLDLRTNPANLVIGDRAFSQDPEQVASHGVAAIQGLIESGVLATAKHFPGHGDTVADSHLTLPESLQSSSRWRAVEFLPFRHAIRAGVPLVLVAHLSCPALDPASPTSLSRPVITGILREELEFEGVVVSDDLEMSAIADRFDLGEAAVRFFEAGGDLALICHNTERQRAAVEAVERAARSGRLSEDRLAVSLERIALLRRWVATHRTPVNVKIARAIVGSADRRQLLQAFSKTVGHSPLP
ncbi:MAG TPA: beta-N-acetylhexosaminidase [Candidatus Methylomirabilis sp.]|nr:beta-N-acetylhexosaminidase [Candidatus Methylomirabilis sp.]